MHYIIVIIKEHQSIECEDVKVNVLIQIHGEVDKILLI